MRKKTNVVPKKKYDEIQEMLLDKSPVDIYKLVLDGSLRRFPLYFWSMPENYQYAIACTKYLIEDLLKWSKEDICTKLNVKIFVDYKLRGMLSKTCNSSPYFALNLAYPDKFKPWELKCTPLNVWTEEMGFEATKWLIEEKLKWTKEDVCNQLTIKTFLDNNLGGMLLKLFNNSPYQAINTVYPNQYKSWELRRSMTNYWNEESSKEAIKWLIEEKLKWTREDICEKLNYKTFIENNLNGMLQHVCNSSPYFALNLAYPDEFKPWELSYTPMNFWTTETTIAATKWLIEEKLKWTREDVCNKLTREVFLENGLRGIYRTLNTESCYEALNLAYPNQYKKEDLKYYNKGCVNNEKSCESK